MVSGKEFRDGLRHNMPTIPPAAAPRVVPAFTIQTLQRGTVVAKPPRCNPFKPKPVGPTEFRKHYIRGDFPIAMEMDAVGRKLAWKADIQKLDFNHYLPMFFEGLKEIEMPYKFFARQGVEDMIANGANKIFPVIPQLIMPIKSALNTKNKEIMCTILKVIQNLVTSVDMAGLALVPYYRQLLPIMNLYKDRNTNCGDTIDVSKQRRENVSDLVNETLELLERYGGEDAYINIKYMIPTYESCMQN